MGVVYRAFDRQTRSHVALKLLRGYATDALRERFVREARALSKVRHPAVVAYVAHGTTDTGDAYLAMEWLEGEDLRARIARDVMPVADAVAVARQVADALASVHAFGIVHRDLKPGNVFLVGSNARDVRLLDFGLVRMLGETAVLTSATTVLGTPSYMAPEQTRAGRVVDARSDVFSLGCVFFECLTGQPPFTGENSFAILAKIAFDDAPRPRDLRPDLPVAFDFLLGRMLAKDPATRLADGAAVRAAIDALDDEERGAGELVEPVGVLTKNEQRLVSILIASSAASTVGDTTQQIDAAMQVHVHETLAQSPLQEEDLRSVVERHGGALRELPNGAIAALFTSAPSATDLATSAARCALALREQRPRARIAIATGRGLLSTRLPLGEAIDRAARLVRSRQGRPEDTSRTDGAIFVDDVTAGLLDARFEIAGARGGDLELCAVRESQDDVRTLLGRPTSCVGRAQELGTLLSSFDACVSEPAARAVVLLGDAGVGKSRLRYELLRALRERAADCETWIARGDPMSAGAPFASMASALLRAAGVRDGEALAVRQRKLVARVARTVPAEADARRVAEFLGEVVGVPFDDDASPKLRAARADAALAGDQVRRAWEELLRAEIAARPFILVLDDFHWGDQPTMRLVDTLLRTARDMPFFAVALARPELHDLFPSLWAGRPVTEIRLGALSPRASAKLVREVLGDATRAEVVARIVEQAAGNAFYLEELIRAEAEGRGDALPKTVVAMVQARLEDLDDGTRQVLRAGSVFGAAFWRGGVRALVSDADEARTLARLASLVERELVAERAHGKFPGETEYAFRHALVREAAYTMLTDADRALGHRMAGEWLARAGERDAAVLAEHFERGRDGARAIAWYERAADRALAANDLAGVVSLVERATACGAAGEALGGLLALRAEAHNWRGAAADGEADALRATELLAEFDARWWVAAHELVSSGSALGKKQALVDLAARVARFEGLAELRGAALRAVARLCRALIVFGHLDVAAPLLAAIESRADHVASTEPASFGWICMARAAQAYFSDDLAGLVRHTEAGIVHFEHVEDARNACLLRGDLAFATIELGRYEDAERVARRGLEVAESMAIRNVAATARQNLGQALAHLGRLDEGLALEEASCEEFRAAGNRRMECASRFFVAMIRGMRGDVARAVDDARAAVAIARQPPALAAMEAHALALLGRAELARGDVASARANAHEAMRLLEAAKGGVDGEATVRLAWAEALAAAGETDAARAAITAARAALDARARAISDPEMRASFLRRVRDNARTLELADALGAPSR